MKRAGLIVSLIMVFLCMGLLCAGVHSASTITNTITGTIVVNPPTETETTE